MLKTIISILIMIAILVFGQGLIILAGVLYAVRVAVTTMFRGFLRGITNSFDEDYEFMRNDYYNGKEPAKKSWFFGPCFYAIIFSVKEAKQLLKEEPQKLYNRVCKIIKTSGWVIKIVLFIITFEIRIIYWIVCLASTYGFALLCGIVFLALLICYYVIFSFVWAIDRLVLLICGFKNDCPDCNERTFIPTYICPNCGAKHYKLSPNKYGIFNHRCECGCYMGSTFLTGKGRLHYACKKCGCIIKGGATRPVSIQLIGGTSTGKTVYLAALFHEFHKCMDNNNASYKPEESCQENMRELENYYNGKICSATSERDSILYSNIITHEKLRVATKLEIIDIPGEIFEGNVAEEQLEHKLSQYKYTDGFVFIIDPYSSGDLVNYRNGDTATSYSSISSNDVFTNFDQYLINQGMTKRNKKNNKPIAIVVSKADTEEVAKRINMKMIADEFESNKEQYEGSFDKCRDEMVREFLNSISQADFISNIETRFANIHYFIVSSMGHKPMENVRYSPWQVYESASWIIERKDRKLFDTVLARKEENVTE